jgi:hypothetical protein
MKYIRKFNEAILYHGKKDTTLFKIDNDEIGVKTPYFYLTSNKYYASSYAGLHNKNKGSLHKFNVDISNLLDLRMFGIEKHTQTYWCNKINTLTGITMPYKVSNIEEPFWLLLRYDREGIIKKYLGEKYDGLIMIEDYSEDHDSSQHESYVLFNKNPIKNEILKKI